MEKRLFISIPITTEIQNILGAYKKNYHLDNIRWIATENLHITIFFLGKIKSENIPEIINLLNNEYKKIPPFKIQFEKIKFAPPNTTATMIWAQFKTNKEYENLIKKTLSCLSKNISIKKNNQKNIPHITLARFKNSIDISNIELKQPLISDLNIDKCILMESKLNQNGSIYSNIAKFDFGINTPSPYGPG